MKRILAASSQPDGGNKTVVSSLDMPHAVSRDKVGFLEKFSRSKIALLGVLAPALGLVVGVHNVSEAQKERVNLERNHGNASLTLSDITKGLENIGLSFDEREGKKNKASEEQFFIRLEAEISDASSKLTAAHTLYKENVDLATTDEEKNRLAKELQIAVVRLSRAIVNIAGMNHVDNSLSYGLLKLCEDPMQKLQEMSGENLAEIVQEEVNANMALLPGLLERKRIACDESQKGKEEGVATL